MLMVRMFDTDVKARILEMIRTAPGDGSGPDGSGRGDFVPGRDFVPVSGKVIGKRETELMTEAVLDGWLTIGRFNDQFEAALASFLGARHTLTVNSGSSANLAALAALTSPELGERAVAPGDEIITTAAGFPTTIAPILQVGAVPVFTDVDEGAWNTDVARLERALSPKTRAVVLAHTLGMPFDAGAVSAFCRRNKLWLIEDCCDALGGAWDGRPVGTYGDFGTLSFYPAHHITTGEGGAVFTDNADLARLAVSFRDWGRHCRCRPGQDNACGRRFSGRYGDLPEGYDHKYVYAHAGYNLKMTDIAAACGLAQLERLPRFVEQRRANYAHLRNRLAGCPHLRLPAPPAKADPAWFGFPALLAEDAPLSRRELQQALDAARIGSRLLFAGNAARQPFMRGKAFRAAGDLPNTDALMRGGFWLGIWPGLTSAMLDHTADTVLNALGG
jgi:CDP-6-deoxy-D-xylo-4-hexulose-3-dehydrase